MTEARNPNTGCLIDVLIWVIGGIALWFATAGAWVFAAPFAVATVVLAVVEIRERF